MVNNDGDCKSPFSGVIPQTQNTTGLCLGNPFMFVFWGTWGMFHKPMLRGRKRSTIWLLIGSTPGFQDAIVTNEGFV